MSEPSQEDLNVLADSDNYYEKVDIIKRFGTLDTPLVIHPILDAIAQGDEELFDVAINSLLKLKNHLDPIVKAEITNNNYFIRWVITKLIEKIQDRNYISYLIPAIGIGYTPVVESICLTLHKLHSKRFPSQDLTKILQALNFAEKSEVALYAIQQLGVKALDSTETLNALHTLQLLDLDFAITPLLKVLHHNDPRIRQETLRILNGYSKERILQHCVEVIENAEYFEEKYDFYLPTEENYELHFYAIEGLGGIIGQIQKARKILWAILRHGTKLEKIFALKALENLHHNSEDKLIPSSEVCEEINKLLENLEGSNKLIAIKTLGKLGEEWAISSILSYLNDTSANIRLAVINALSNSKQSNILDKVAFLLVDKNKIIRTATVRLFEELDPHSFKMHTKEGNIIDKMPEPTRTALLEKLISGLHNSEEEYRQFAIFWLGTLAYQPAFNELINQLQSFSKKIIRDTITALGIFGNAKAIPHLIPFIYDSKHEEIRTKAVEVIGMLGENHEGLIELIHQLFLNYDVNPPILEDHILTFGAQIIPLIAFEIDNETEIRRKNLLNVFFSKIKELFEFKTEEDYKILL